MKKLLLLLIISTSIFASTDKNTTWIYVNILDTIFFVFYEYFFSNSIGLKYPNLL